MRDLLRTEQTRAALNAATLTGFAATQPLFDLLARAPEFLVAHRASGPGILALTIALSLALPAAAAVLVWGAFRVHARAGRAVIACVVFVCVSLLALLSLRPLPIGGPLHAGAAIAIGALAALAYAKRPALRTFVTWLSPGLLLFPLLFLANPAIRSLIWPRGVTAQASSASETPVVMVVFDQFPLTSLLDAQQQIDPVRYPAFAALASDATWYRNATTVSDYTRWALPAILTGRRPRPDSLPVAAHHPANLFTLLGASHHMRVFEPITAMCPQEICGRDAVPLPAWIRAIARELSTAYLHAVVPPDFASALPPVDQGWNERPEDTEGDSIGARWYEQHRRGRRQGVLDFIDSIGEGVTGRPPFHFLHVLLPHEPFIYFPDGRRFSIETTLPGLIGRELWHDDEWAVAQAYRRHLLQAGYVDRLLGQLIAHLKETGLYDRSLLVVTSDHGASFRAGKAFRRLTPETMTDILAVPLLVKRPYQEQAEVSDRNVEAIDLVPTMADLLDISVPWAIDGASAVGQTPERAEKRAYHDDARRSTALPSSLLADVFAGAARVRALFGEPHANPFLIPATAPEAGLAGQPLGALRLAEGADVRLVLDVRGDFSNVDLAGDRVPAYLAGTADGPRDGPAVLAIALNGVVQVTTRTYSFEEGGSRNAWSSVLPPGAFRQGRNDLEIFVVARDAAGPVLRRVYRSASESLDLSAPAAVYAWGVTQEGLHDREWRGDTPFRWTSDIARMTVPLESGRVPRALRVSLLMSGRKNKPLRISINGCELFDGGVPSGPWARTFDLSACPPLGASAVIELRTEPSRSRVRTDRRWLGVAVQRIDLIDAPSS